VKLNAMKLVGGISGIIVGTNRSIEHDGERDGA
jgi:hypothetical protein